MTEFACFICESTKDLTNLICTVHACGKHMRPPSPAFPRHEALALERALEDDGFA